MPRASRRSVSTLAGLELDGFLVPRADEHQNEYVAGKDERLAWLSGFTGSAGLAVVLQDRAAIFVDGRYVLAVRDQVDPAIFTPVALTETTPEKWLEANLRRGSRLGYDPWLHTPSAVERLAKAAASSRRHTRRRRAEPDRFDLDRPAAAAARQDQPPCAEIRGRNREPEARARRAALSAAPTRLLVSDPHAVAWVFNIRGKDVSHTPLPLAYALILKAGRPRLYIDGRKLDAVVRDKLAEARRSRRARTSRVGSRSCSAEEHSMSCSMRDGSGQAGPDLVKQAGGDLRHRAAIRSP